MLVFDFVDCEGILVDEFHFGRATLSPVNFDDFLNQVSSLVALTLIREAKVSAVAEDLRTDTGGLE